MAKTILYVNKDSGVDGMGPEVISEVFGTEAEREDWHATNKNAPWRTKDEILVDPKRELANARAALTKVQAHLLKKKWREEWVAEVAG